MSATVRAAAVTALAIGVLMLAPLALDTYMLNILVRAMFVAMAAITVDIMWGYCGTLTFGQSAFFGIGVYALAIIFTEYGFGPWQAALAVAAAVIVASLLIQGTSLPWLLRRLGLRAEDFGTEEDKARLKAARAALQWLDDYSGAENADEATKSARALYEAKVRRLQLISPDDEEPDEAREMERYRALRLELLGVERSTVLALRRDGSINATLMRAIERDFDLEEARISGS
jgi:hypothetical protein